MTLALPWRTRTSTTRIILHDSHTGPEVKTVADYLRVYGRTRGLLDVGYHTVIERDGSQVPCRPIVCVGSHTPGHNLYSIGICLAGGDDGSGNPEDNFTDAQLAALATCVRAIHHVYGPIPLIGHTEIQRYRNRLLQCPARPMDLFRQQLGLD